MNFSVDDLAKMLIIKAFDLDRKTGWVGYINYCSDLLTVLYSKKDDEHDFRMSVYLEDKDAKDTLRNYIANIERLEREYNEQNKQN